MPDKQPTRRPLLANGEWRGWAKYWGFFLAKLVAAVVILRGVQAVALRLLNPPDTFMYVRPKHPFGHDLGFTFLVFLYFLLAVGLVWISVWDQRYRCRTCLRRLRMPIHKDTWSHVLFGAPRTEYICLYGHGTLKVAELQITGRQNPDWEPHEDIWKELLSYEETK
jgi:hypothetical protein